MLTRTLTALLAALAASLALAGSAAALDIADASPPTGTVGVPYSFTFSLSPGSGSSGSSWSVISGQLPPGLALSSNDRTALVYGTPTQAGSFSFYLQVRDKPGPWVCCTEEQFTISIQPALAITGDQLPVGNVGAAYGHQLGTSGGTAQTWSLTAGALPEGMQLTAAGAIVGTPGKAVAAQFTVEARDGDRKAAKQLTLKVTEPMSVSAPAGKAVKLGKQFVTQFAVKGGLGPYTWSGVGLPAGVGVNAGTGQVGGRPKAPGPLTVTLTVTDSLGATATASTKVTVASKLALLTRALPSARAGVRFRATLRTSGGAGPVRLRLTGEPGWLHLRQGTLSGTPKVVAPKSGAKGAKRPRPVTYLLDVVASDALGQRATTRLRLTVRPRT